MPYGVLAPDNTLYSLAFAQEELADELPAGYTVHEFTEAEYDDLRGGWKRWDPATSALVATGRRTLEEEDQARQRAEQWVQDLRGLYQSAVNAKQALNAIQNRNDLASGTLSTAVLSTAARALQADSKTMAQILEGTITQLVKMIRRDLGDLYDTDGT
jgi:hypothetical protein